MSIAGATQPTKQKATYDPSIDFIRFLAFFFVFFTHFVNHGGNAIQVDTGQWWNNELIQRFADFSGQGVTLFFGLTGFLLGRLLIREMKQSGTVSIGAFYLRRTLRIWPLYFAFIAMCAILNNFSNSPTLTIKELPYLATFSYNWGQLFGGLPGTMATITWSISVEEQIYILFPVLFLIFAKRSATKYSMVLILTGFASVIGCLYFWHLNPARFTPAFLLPVGVGLLAAKFEDKLDRPAKKRLIRYLLVAILILYIFTFRNISASHNFQFLTYLASALLLPVLIYLSRPYLIGTKNMLLHGAVYIGRRSYGCYLFHWAIWTIMVGKHIFSSTDGGFSVIGVLAGFTLTVITSGLSYRFFETPFLRYRRRFQKVVSP